MKTGIVKWFNEEQGFGFIETAEQKDVLIHFSATQKSGYRTLAEAQATLSEGSRVTFDLAEGDEGLEAVNIRGDAMAEEESSAAPINDAADRESVLPDAAGS